MPLLPTALSLLCRRAQHEAWVARRYHQPSDEISPDWKLGGAVQDARLSFLLGEAVAQAPGLPS